MTFSDQLKQYRKQFSLNQAELAKFLEVSPRSVWKWENGVFPHILTQEGAIQKMNQKKIQIQLNIQKEALEAADECLSLIEDVSHGAMSHNVTVARRIVLNAITSLSKL